MPGVLYMVMIIQKELICLTILYSVKEKRILLLPGGTINKQLLKAKQECKSSITIDATFRPVTR